MGATLCAISLLSIIMAMLAAAAAIWHGLQYHDMTHSNQVPDDRE